MHDVPNLTMDPARERVIREFYSYFQQQEKSKLAGEMLDRVLGVGGHDMRFTASDFDKEGSPVADICIETVYRLSVIGVPLPRDEVLEMIHAFDQYLEDKTGKGLSAEDLVAKDSDGVRALQFLTNSDAACFLMDFLSDINEWFTAEQLLQNVEPADNEECGFHETIAYQLIRNIDFENTDTGARSCAEYFDPDYWPLGRYPELLKIASLVEAEIHILEEGSRETVKEYFIRLKPIAEEADINGDPSGLRESFFRCITLAQQALGTFRGPDTELIKKLKYVHDLIVSHPDVKRQADLQGAFAPAHESA